MAVFRIDKNKNYTVMSNYHLRDMELSCKACGLLSKMLSLPEEWDYTTRGLARICKDGVESIGTALKELENRGYLVRSRVRDEKGRIKDTEYIIYETPNRPESGSGSAAPDTTPPDQVEPDTVCPDIDCPDTDCPDTAYPDTGNPDMDYPDTDAPRPENPAQLNTKKSNTQKSITYPSSTDSFLPSVPSVKPAPAPVTDGRTEREAIREQIEYDYLVNPGNRAQLDELVELMVEVAMNRSPTIKFGREAEYPTGYVQDRFRQLTSEHIEKVLDGIRENTTRVRNTKAYLMAALFNSVSTLDNHYAMLVNHDFHGNV